ncbi:hypothetical protein OG21DRAFT_140664 [Imleria badia]|nr:hypothetical protein OG21DRAFT_140664 [Imleria badia]
MPFWPDNSTRRTRLIDPPELSLSLWRSPGAAVSFSGSSALPGLFLEHLSSSEPQTLPTPPF